MRAGFVQFNPRFGDVEGNLQRIEELLRNCNLDIVVLPELCTSGYLFTSHGEVESLAEEIPDGMSTKRLCRIARERRMVIVAGLAERKGNLFFNSAVVVTPEGYRGTYRKIHLFYEEKLWFAPGDGEFQIYDVGFCKIGVMICFDWIFPESVRILSLKGAELICHPANLVLPFCQDAMVTRCLENRVFAITANRTGVEKRGGKSLTFTGMSQIAAPGAVILLRSTEDREEVGVAEIDVDGARNKQVNDFNNLFKDRRPFLYRLLGES
ncbi:MAG: acyltransferase [Deltaproteobacteria bacterium]|nr:acyltransferase [Deltaproteobacteria bacterium]